MADAIVERARQLVSLVRASSDRTEREGTLPAEVADALRDAGMFALMVPKDVGGEGADLLTAIEAIEIISRADGSTGWSMMANALATALAAAHCGDRAAEAIFGASGGRAVLAGMLAPGGSCVPVEGGYRGSGMYHFASGSGHADWLSSGMLVIEGDMPRKLGNGLVEVRAVLAPRDSVELLGNWHVAGLNGTGSFDYRVPEQFFDDDFTFEITSTEPRRGGREFEISVFGFSALGHGAVALGICARALEEIAKLAPNKKRLGYRDGVGKHPVFLHEFAHHEAMYQAARSYLYDVFRKAQATLDSGGVLGDEIRHRFRQALTYVHRVAEQVVEWCYRWAGTDALRNPHPLGRCLRDIHGATQHIFVDPLSYVDAAPALLEAWHSDSGTAT